MNYWDFKYTQQNAYSISYLRGTTTKRLDSDCVMTIDNCIVAELPAVVNSD